MYFDTLVFWWNPPSSNTPAQYDFFFGGWVAEPWAQLWAVQHEPGNRDLSIGGEPDLDLEKNMGQNRTTLHSSNLAPLERTYPRNWGYNGVWLLEGMTWVGSDLRWQATFFLWRRGSSWHKLEVLDVTWFCWRKNSAMVTGCVSPFFLG